MLVKSLRVDVIYPEGLPVGLCKGSGHKDFLSVPRYTALRRMIFLPLSLLLEASETGEDVQSDYSVSSLDHLPLNKVSVPV